MTMQELFDTVDYYKNMIERNRPIYLKQQEELDHYFRTGFTLNESQMHTTDKGEETGLLQAYDNMLTVARNDQQEITEAVIKKLHYLIYYKIDPEQAGQYRKAKVSISEGEKEPPLAEDVPHLMEHFINQMKTSQRFMHPIEFAAMCLKRLTEIHPFMNANTIVAKLFMSLILVKAGYGITSISPVLDSEFKKALVLSQKEINPDIDTLIKFIAERVLESEMEYIKLLNINDK